jgi:hypothetical protein
MRFMVVVLLAASVACHRNREIAVERPTAAQLEGAYSFTINSNGIFMEGRFVIADTQVFLYVDARCEFADAPESSEGMRATWFDCNRTREGAFLQLRISQVDPVNKSRWHARRRELDTVTRCAVYTVNGDCTQVVRARGMKWVDRYGQMIVTRGMPPIGWQDERRSQPTGSRPLRVRCDTSATGSNCRG